VTRRSAPILSAAGSRDLALDPALLVRSGSALPQLTIGAYTQSACTPDRPSQHPGALPVELVKHRQSYFRTCLLSGRRAMGTYPARQPPSKPAGCVSAAHPVRGHLFVAARHAEYLRSGERCL
jgi:hypothetical protein